MRDNDRPSLTSPALVSKEEKLKEFILSYLARAAAKDIGAAEAGEVLLIAKCPASPVARAVAGVAAGQSTRFTLQVIFATSPGGEQTTTAGSDVTHYADAVGIIESPRLMDVHEQLVLGSATVWYGDSMRREPEKRDAFERYIRDTEEAGRDARRSFARLWAHASRLKVTRPASEKADAALVAIPTGPDSGLATEAMPPSAVKPH